jgi:DNA integrity scanning protein DisA with diadenylate cyclase activity
VSEETGIISLAENGTLTRNMDESNLREYLPGIMA